jgi:formamidopyrimidine-DNA glycosylase
MPELPDVEHFRRFFVRHAGGRTIEEVTADPTIVRNATPEALHRGLRGRRFEAEPERVGKWLTCWTDGPALIVHFGMTGYFWWGEDATGRHPHDRMVITFAGGGELRYRNMRKLGGVWLAHDPNEAAEILGPLGPDALTVSRSDFLQRLSRRRGGAKAALMDQMFVAGVGNLMADEILWQARLHPRRPIESMSQAERATLFRSMHRVLRRAVDVDDYMTRHRTWLVHVRGTPGAVCPRDRTPLERTVAAGRTTYFCPVCQPASMG